MYIVKVSKMELGSPSKKKKTAEPSYGPGTWDEVQDREVKGHMHTHTSYNPGDQKEGCGRFDQEKKLLQKVSKLLSKPSRTNSHNVSK